MPNKYLREKLLGELSYENIADVDKIYSGNTLLMIHGLHSALSDTMQQHDDRRREKIMLLLAYGYEENENYEEAAYWYNKCLSEDYFRQRIVYKYHLLENIIINTFQESCQTQADIFDHELIRLFQEDDPAESIYYLALKNYIKAIKIMKGKEQGSRHTARELLMESLNICAMHKNELVLEKLSMAVHETLGDLAFHDGEIRNSLECYRSALDYAIRSDYKRKSAYYHRKISFVLEKAGNIIEALGEYKLYYRQNEDVTQEQARSFSEYLLETYNLHRTMRAINRQMDRKNILSKKRYLDPLTGVFNRRYWNDAISDKLENLIREPWQITVLMTDIDQFKMYNDNYGHVKGDEALRQVAQTLLQCVRKDSDIVVRFGGEEFLLLLDKTALAESKEAAARIMHAINRLGIDHLYGGISDKLTMSIGLATGVVKTKEQIDEVIREADRALYYSKQNGRNTFTHITDMV